MGDVLGPLFVGGTFCTLLGSYFGYRAQVYKHAIDDVNL
jgi:hypothetical protein